MKKYISLGFFIFFLLSISVVIFFSSIRSQIFKPNSSLLDSVNLINKTTSLETTKLANPASLYCEELGGRLEIRSDNQGNQIGWCISSEGEECEEWKFYRKECQFGQKPLPDPLSPTIEPFIINFDQEGNIVNTDPLKSSEGPDFSLLYEKPGKPAIKTDLLFTEDSLCDLGQGFKICKTSDLHVGNRVLIKGIMEEGKVKIVQIIKKGDTPY